MLFYTLWSLFAPDMMMLVENKETDIYFSYVLLACFIYFAIELVLCTVFRRTYFNSFFFWLDLLGTASLVLDIPWFAEGLGLNFEDDDALYERGPLKYVDFELWQVKAGTIFDNILVTNDAAYAKVRPVL